MIELGDIEEYDVEISAVIGVKRTIRVMAGGESHARMVARKTALSDEATHTWVAPNGEIITVEPDRISDIITSMCPTKAKS